MKVFELKTLGFELIQTEKVMFELLSFYCILLLRKSGGYDKHGKQGFVIPTKSFVKIGITKIFCYNNKIFGSINTTFGCCSKIFGCSNKKKIFFVPNFVAVTKPFFFRVL